MTDRPTVAPRYSKVLREDSLDRMRAAFHRANPSMVLAWRLGFGPLFNMWPSVGGRMLVLSHSGRKTGTRYRTPLNYAPVGDDLYCLAGYGSRTDWYRNITVQPEVEIWLPTGRWAAVAFDASDDPDRVARMRDVLVASGFAARAIGLVPKRMTGHEIDETTQTYRLVRIVSTGRRSPGPADLAWLWMVPLIAYVTRAIRDSRRV